MNKHNDDYHVLKGWTIKVWINPYGTEGPTDRATPSMMQFSMLWCTRLDPLGSIVFIGLIASEGLSNETMTLYNKQELGVWLDSKSIKSWPWPLLVHLTVCCSLHPTLMQGLLQGHWPCSDLWLQALMISVPFAVSSILTNLHKSFPDCQNGHKY